jgi:hypothetical protein
MTTLRKITGDGLKIVALGVNGKDLDVPMLRNPQRCGLTLYQQATDLARSNPNIIRIYSRKGEVLYESERKTYQPTVTAPAALEGAAAADPKQTTEQRRKELKCERAELHQKILAAQTRMGAINRELWQLK